MRKIIIFSILTISILFSCKSSENKDNSVIVDEKIAIQKDVIIKDVKLEPKKHYRITVDNENQNIDTLILKLKNKNGEIIGSNYDEGTSALYSTFDVICDGKCGVDYVVEINSKNGNKLNGNLK